MSATLVSPTLAAPASNGRILPRLFGGPYTVADWIAFEENKKRKHQLRNGEFIEMSGAALEHNIIAKNFMVSLTVKLDEAEANCTVLGSDQKVYIDNRNGLYPDVVVFCGEPLITPDEALQNPVLIVEVLSPSTAGDDRGEKFELYRTRPTLQHYLLVEQHRPSVDHYQKGENGIWSLVADHHALTETLTVTLSGATVAFPLATLYRGVSFPASTTPEA